MHRRQFINAAASALLLPAGLVHARQDDEPASTPSTPPEHHGRPRPVVLGDGIELIDYRIYPSKDVPRIIGEITSTRDEMVDSPVVSITFPDLGDQGLAYAPPVLPVMRPGESNMIFGVLPHEIQTNQDLESATYGLCSTVEIGPLAAHHADLGLRIEIIKQERGPTAQRIEGVLHNEADTEVRSTKIRGLVRDRNLRYAGVVPEMDMWTLLPHTSIPFGFWLTPQDKIAANPYSLLDGSSEYFTELFPGTVGNIINPGCSAFRD